MTSAESAQAAKQLDSVTDRVQETELDSSKVRQAMAGVGSNEAAKSTKSTLTLAQIRVARDDINVLMEHFEVTEDQAIKALKECSLEIQQAGGSVEGDVVLAAALKKLLHALPGQ